MPVHEGEVVALAVSRRLVGVAQAIGRRVWLRATPHSGHRLPQQGDKPVVIGVAVEEAVCRDRDFRQGHPHGPGDLTGRRPHQPVPLPVRRGPADAGAPVVAIPHAAGLGAEVIEGIQAVGLHREALGAVEDAPVLEVGLQGRAGIDGIRGGGAVVAGREKLVVVLKVEHAGAGDLLQIAGTGRLPGAGADLDKHRGQQGGQDNDHGDHHEQLHKGEAAPPQSSRRSGGVGRCWLHQVFHHFFPFSG